MADRTTARSLERQAVARAGRVAAGDETLPVFAAKDERRRLQLRITLIQPYDGVIEFRAIVGQLLVEPFDFVLACAGTTASEIGMRSQYRA